MRLYQPVPQSRVMFWGGTPIFVLCLVLIKLVVFGWPSATTSLGAALSAAALSLGILVIVISIGVSYDLMRDKPPLPTPENSDPAPAASAALVAAEVPAVTA